MENSPLMEVKGISKSFTSTKALQQVSLAVYPGEVHGLIGENGSGKSTLSAIISGNLKADEGEMFLFGKPYRPADSFDASQYGVSMIVQEQGTIDTVSVAANICAGREGLVTKIRQSTKSGIMPVCPNITFQPFHFFCPCQTAPLLSNRFV